MNIAIAQSAVGTLSVSTLSVGTPVDLARRNQPDIAVIIDPGADK